MSQPFTDAELAAFLDGTLADEALCDAIEAAINADPALAERAEALAAGADPAASSLRAAFAPLLQAPVPDHLVQIVAGTPVAAVTAADLPSRAPPRALPIPANDTGGSWRWPQFAAMAASLVLGVVIGGPLLTGGSPGAGGADGDAGADGGAGAALVFASAPVDGMLARAPSGQKVDLASLGTGEVVLTFRNAQGQLCRQFTLEGGGATSDALACASGAGGAGGAGGGGWQIEAFGRRAAPAGEMKLAGGDAAPAVVAAVDAMIASDPLVGADEAAELAKQ
jgi:hypothetical protein